VVAGHNMGFAAFFAQVDPKPPPFGGTSFTRIASAVPTRINDYTIIAIVGCADL
jgi:hypothetical protein